MESFLLLTEEAERVSHWADGSTGEEWLGVLQHAPFNVFIARGPRPDAWASLGLTGPCQSWLYEGPCIGCGDSGAPSTVVVALGNGTGSLQCGALCPTVCQAPQEGEPWSSVAGCSNCPGICNLGMSSLTAPCMWRRQPRCCPGHTWVRRSQAELWNARQLPQASRGVKSELTIS